MKLIRSRGSQLSKAEEEIESLRKENHELRQDNRTLRAQFAQLARVTGRTLPKPVARNSTPQRTSGPSSSNGTTPPYAQPTRASHLRDVTSTSSTTAKTPRKSASSSPSPKLTISTSTGDNDSWNPTVPVAGAVKVNGKDVLYDNAKIKVMRFGFLESTRSHVNRVFARKEEFPHARFFSSSNDGSETPATKTQHEKHQPAMKFEIMPKATFDALISRSGYEKRRKRLIETRTRLSENQFIGMSCSVYINHDRLWEIAREALEVAKRCVFRWFCVHRRTCFNYLSDIDFGRDRITGTFSIMPYTVQGKLESLIRLRNDVCHFSGCGNVSSWDRSVKDVHEFAVLLLDEEGAREARGLRDQLHAEAEKTLDEIETLAMLNACAGAGDGDGILWCKHHRSTVQSAVSKLDYDLGHRGLDTAAREWASHHRGLDYGRTGPYVERCTGASPDAADMPEDKICHWETMKWPRGSISMEAGCPDNVLKGAGNKANGRSAADFYTLV